MGGIRSTFCVSVVVLLVGELVKSILLNEMRIAADAVKCGPVITVYV